MWYMYMYIHVVSSHIYTYTIEHGIVMIFQPTTYSTFFLLFNISDDFSFVFFLMKISFRLFMSLTQLINDTINEIYSNE